MVDITVTMADEIESEENSLDEDELRKQRMQEFNEMVQILFSKPERLILYKILKDYQRRRDVVRLVVGLDLILRTYTKLELLKYVRYFVWHGHLDEFDKLTHFRTKFRRRRPRQKKTHLLAPDHRSIASTSTNASGRRFKDVRVFTIHREKDEPSLGFCVRGGSEHALGIYVSEVDSGSTAEMSGLEVGDKILEVNNISLKGIASSTAVKVLTGSNRLKLVIQRTRKVPEWRMSREKTAWYDVHKKKLISGEFEECGISHSIRGLEVEVPERRISLKYGKSSKSLGFNIRGGREFGLGIYVSKVDRGGLADSNGVRIGDQIIDVNGIPFENITHANAVEVLKGKRHLILTLRDVGRFPVFKELYAEYTWSDSLIRPATSTRSLHQLHATQHELPEKAQSVSELFSGRRKPSALNNEIFLPGEKLSQASVSSERINHTMDLDDDNESLIDLDQWAKDIQDTGSENKAFVHDENKYTITVHTGDEPVNRKDSRQYYTDAELAAIDREEELERDYDTTDLLYAKINKHDSRYASTSNLNIRNDRYDDEDKRSESDIVAGTSHEIYSEIHYNTTEDRLDTSNEELRTSSPVVEGALYSTVRRLSAGSFKNLTGSASTLSIYGSNRSIRKKVVDNETIESSNVSVSHRQRKKSVTYSDKDNDTESEDEHGADSYDVTNVYLTDTLQQNINGDDKEHVKPGISGAHNDIGEEDEQIDLETLETRLQVLQARQTTLGMQELNTLDTRSRDDDESSTDSIVYEGGVKKKGKWKSLKNKIKGSLRMKSNSQSKKNSVDMTPATDEVYDWSSEKIDSVNMAQLDEEAKRLLNEDEFKAVKRHIKSYHENHDVERLVEVLLVILDKPEKLTILKDVRGIIYRHDMAKYDNMVNHYEIEAYQKLSMKLHLPLNHKPQKKPRRKLITTEMDTSPDVPNVAKSPSTEPGEAEDGHFHIKTMGRAHRQREVVDTLKEHAETSRAAHPYLRRQRRASDSNEKAALEKFEYLDVEHSDDGSYVAAFSDSGSYSAGGELEKQPGSVIVHLSKTKQSLGIEFVEEMVNGEREVKIHRIDPHGAAHDDSTIDVGMTVLAVDRHRVEGCSLEEICAITDTLYMDKQHVSMKLMLRKSESTQF